jgi:hypothetical protein
MTTTDLRTPTEWLATPEFAGWRILDYDGWRNANWDTPIDLDEFRHRLFQCTISAPVASATHDGARP